MKEKKEAVTVKDKVPKKKVRRLLVKLRVISKVYKSVHQVSKFINTGINPTTHSP